MDNVNIDSGFVARGFVASFLAPGHGREGGHDRPSDAGDERHPRNAPTHTDVSHQTSQSPLSETPHLPFSEANSISICQQQPPSDVSQTSPHVQQSDLQPGAIQPQSNHRITILNPTQLPSHNLEPSPSIPHMCLSRKRTRPPTEPQRPTDSDSASDQDEVVDTALYATGTSPPPVEGPKRQFIAKHQITQTQDSTVPLNLYTTIGKNSSSRTKWTTTSNHTKVVTSYPLSVGSFNVRSLIVRGNILHPLFHRSKIQALIEFMHKQNVLALALQEHRFIHLDSSQIQTHFLSHQYTLHTASAMYNSQGAPTGGLAWLVHNQLHPHIHEIKTLQSGILLLHLVIYGHTLQLVNIHSPSAHTSEHSSFYAQLRRLHSNLKVVGPVIYCGDFNATLTPHDDGPLGHTGSLSKQTQHARDNLVSFLHESHTTSIGTHHNWPPFTFKGPFERHITLDHIVCQRNHPRVFSRRFVTLAPPIPSDHRPILANVTLHFYTQKLQLPTLILHQRSQKDFSKLHSSNLTDIAHYRAPFIDFILSNTPRPLTVDRYHTFLTTVHEATATYLPLKTKHAHPSSGSFKTQLQTYNNNTNPNTDYRVMRDLFIDVTTAHTRDINTRVLTLCDTVEQHLTKNPIAAYHALKQITRGKYRPNAEIAGNTTENKLQSIRDFCKSQLTTSCVTPDGLFKTVQHSKIFNEELFTLDELHKVTKKLSHNKAPGPDDITTEIVKTHELQSLLLEVINDCFTKTIVPTQFVQSVMSMIPKPGKSHAYPEGWRYIALMSVIAKVYDALLLNRIRVIIDPLLRYNQNGFRAKRSTLEHAMCLRHLIDRAKTDKSSLVLTFVDFSNAFPSVTHASVSQALDAFLVPPRLKNAILSMYNNHQVTVRTKYGNTDSFQATSGVLQGDTLAPYLFIMVLDCVLRTALDDIAHRGVQIKAANRSLSTLRNYTPPIHLTDCDFADDIVLCSETVTNAQIMLNRLASVASQVNLQINTAKGKTEYMIVHPPHDWYIPLKLHDKQVHKVQHYKYLGVFTDEDIDFKTRRGQAWSRIYQFRSVWQQPAEVVSLDTRLRLFRTFIEPILLYPTPTYVLNDDRCFKLDQCQTHMLKRIYNIDPTSHTSHEQLLSATNTRPPLLSTLAISRQQSTCYKVLNASQNQPFQILLKQPPKLYHFNPSKALLPSIIHKHATHYTASSDSDVEEDESSAAKHAYLLQFSRMRKSDAKNTINKITSRVEHTLTEKRRHNYKTRKRTVIVNNYIQAHSEWLQHQRIPDRPREHLWPFIKTQTTDTKIALLKQKLHTKSVQNLLRDLASIGDGPHTNAHTLRPTSTPIQFEHAYGDGSVIEQSRKGHKNSHTKAGYGVFYGSNDSRNIAQPAPGNSINRCELLAAIHALRSPHHVIYYTDSAYVHTGIKNVAKWLTKHNTPHKDLWYKIHRILHARKQLHLRTNILKVKAHTGITGNEAADQLAKQAAESATSVASQEGPSSRATPGKDLFKHSSVT